MGSPVRQKAYISVLIKGVIFISCHIIAAITYVGSLVLAYLQLLDKQPTIFNEAITYVGACRLHVATIAVFLNSQVCTGKRICIEQAINQFNAYMYQPHTPTTQSINSQ